MMSSSSELKPQDVLSTDTLNTVSVLQLSLGHTLQEITECHIKEINSEIIHDAEQDLHSAKDIKIEPQEEYDVPLDDNNQCLHLEESLDVIKSELDDVETDDRIKLEIEETILEETESNVAGSYSQLADNIYPKVAKIELQRTDINDSTTGDDDSKNKEFAALKDTGDTTTNKRKIKVENKEETEIITIKEPTTVTKKTRVEKPTSNILETCEKFDIKLNKCKNIVTSIVNNVCEEKCTNNTSLEHNVSSISISKNKQFSCETCKKCFVGKSQLKNHIRIHTGEKPYACNVCTKCFTKKSDLNRHIRTHTGEKPYVCNVCKKGFAQNKYLKAHIRTHTGEKPYQCHVCTKCFQEKDYLIRHIRIHTEKPYVCNICKKCFKIRFTLETHIRTHTGDKPYRCNVCDKCFIRKSILENHIRTHTGEKPYECTVCKKCFIQKNILENHIRTHTGKRPYVCNICKKCFKIKSTLESHIRTHTGEKPYACNVCKKRFIQKSQLKNHIRTHTGEKP